MINLNVPDKISSHSSIQLARIRVNSAQFVHQHIYFLFTFVHYLTRNFEWSHFRGTFTKIKDSRRWTDKWRSSRKRLDSPWWGGEGITKWKGRGCFTSRLVVGVNYWLRIFADFSWHVGSSSRQPTATLRRLHRAPKLKIWIFGGKV